MSFEERRVGRYVLTDRLGEGGMGEAYLGRTEGANGFERKVVLKRLLPEAKKHEAYFKAEAKICSQLHHENIIAVTDFFAAEDGALYIVMEYVSGVDLGKLLGVHRRVPLAVALNIVRSIALGLHYAHEAKDETDKKKTPLNIVHRDVSPDNVLISRDGQIKVIDFGVAAVDQYRTKTQAEGSLKGKFGYMDPEMLRGKNVDRRADVYAVGVILWELLTGQRAFPPMSSMEALAVKVMSGDVAQLRLLAPGLPEALYSLVQGAMANKSEERIATCEDIVVALEQIMPECASRKTQRELSRLVISALGEEAPKDTASHSPVEAARKPSPPADQQQKPRTLRLADHDPPMPPAADHPVAEPWKTTLRPDGGKLDPDLMAVPHEIKDDTYTKIAIDSRPQLGGLQVEAVEERRQNGASSRQMPLLSADDEGEADRRLIRAGRPTIPSSKPSRVAPTRRRVAWPVVIGVVVVVAVAVTELGVALLHRSKADAAPMVDPHASGVTPEAMQAPSPTPTVAQPQAAPSGQQHSERSTQTPVDEPSAQKHKQNDQAEAAKFSKRAEAEYYDGRYKEAIASASHAIKLGSAGASAYVTRGASELKLSMDKNAHRDFKAALKIEPSNESARDGLEALKKKTTAAADGGKGKVVLSGPAFDCRIDGQIVGNAPIELELPAGEHDYHVQIDQTHGTGGDFTVVAGKTIKLTPALDSVIQEAMEHYQKGRVAVARETAKKAVELATKGRDYSKLSTAYKIAGAADCQMGHKEIATAAVTNTSPEDEEFVRRACKGAGVQLP